MVNIDLPFDTGSNPQIWLENITDGNLIFAIRETTGEKLEDIRAWVDDTRTLISRGLDRDTDWGVFQPSQTLNPLMIPFKVSITSPFSYNIDVLWTPTNTIDTSQAQVWMTGLTDLKNVFIIREENFKPLTNLSLHLRDTSDTYTFTFSNYFYWFAIQIDDLKNDLTSPYDVSVTSTENFSLKIFKV